MKELTENYLAKSWLNGFLESSWVKRLLTLKLHMRYEDWSQKVTKEVANPRIQPTALRAAADARAVRRLNFQGSMMG